MNLQIKKFNRMYFNSLTLIAILGVALTVLVILNHFWTTLYCVATDSTWLESLFIRFVEQINFVKLHGRNSWGNRISHFKFRENALLEKLLSIWHRSIVWILNCCFFVWSTNNYIFNFLGTSKEKSSRIWNKKFLLSNLYYKTWSFILFCFQHRDCSVHLM